MLWHFTSKVNYDCANLYVVVTIVCAVEFCEDRSWPSGNWSSSGV